MARPLRQTMLLLCLLLMAQLPSPVFADRAADPAQHHSSRFSGPVLPQDTLTGIALPMVEQYPDFTLHQLMAGLYRANPGAFRDGDRQRLIPGSVLKWPGPELLRSIPVESARQLFQAPADSNDRVQEQASTPAGSTANDEHWPLWLRWLLTNLLAIIVFAGISVIWQLRSSRQPEDDGALDEETLLEEIAGEKIPYLPKEFPGKTSAKGKAKRPAQAKAPASKSDASPSETDIEIQLDIALAYVEIGRPRQAHSILRQVIESGTETQRRQARQLLNSIGRSS